MKRQKLLISEIKKGMARLISYLWGLLYDLIPDPSEIWFNYANLAKIFKNHQI